MKIKISEELNNKLPNFRILVMTFNVDVGKNKELDIHIDNLEKEIFDEFTLEEVLKIPEIEISRKAYKTLGKDPSRYRLSSESLLRRLVKKNKLYRINNVVDCGNVLSINCKRPVSLLDIDKIKGDILIRVGKSSDDYFGIGRGKVNIENIPIYVDDISPFGSPTSDTERTMIRGETKKVLLFVLSFNGDFELKSNLEYAKSIFTKFCHASNFESDIIGHDGIEFVVD